MVEHECKTSGMLELPDTTDENAKPVEEEGTTNEIQFQRFFKLSEKRISLGINISILIILTIFGVLLSLPLRMLLNTNYYCRNQTVSGNDTTKATENATTTEMIAVPINYRKLKLCPKFQYKDYIQSIFRNYYDRNCSYARFNVTDDSIKDQKEDTNGTIGDTGETSMITKDDIGENLTESTEESGKDRRTKSVPVAGHILVTMLLISAIAALIEVLRIRFARDKDSSKAGNASSRKASTVELPVRSRFFPRQPMNSQRSFEMQGMHRPALRLLGARPPPLIRRSSFPTQPSKQNIVSVTGTPNNRMSRRQSAESDEEIGVLINALHHRTRLIRRH
ncbi:uncharacterized protein LOC122400994 [Colletes gigas]|uniref:uncharacterized protein LOC122400994 n=1 Tax=Colletes gigas TaxID=935657 RepID=UPI001C9AF4E7|nr:uncharacterized protein LOC122400994 [Colletes gigas]XP_043258760.1 uncharacterized protein LOC122400994 [Colletes gigas]